MGNTNEAGKSIERYFIDFNAPPTLFEQNFSGENITRENITAFIVESFAISRGKVPIQRILFRWASKRFGVDLFTTFSSNRNNIWDLMTEEEKECFLKKYLSIGKHPTMYIERGSNRLIPPNEAEKKEEHMRAIRNELINLSNYCAPSESHDDSFQVNGTETFDEIKQKIIEEFFTKK